VPTSIAAFVGAAARGPRNKPVRIQSFAEYQRTFGGLRPRRPLSYAVRHFFDNGGRQAYVVRVGRHARPTAAEISGSAAAKAGIHALERVDIFNLLVLPDPAASVAVLARALAYCGRRRAFLLLDVPESAATPAQVEAWILSSASPLRSRDAAAYFPRILAADALRGGAVRAFPVSGALAGVYARIDEKRGVWKAPAGVEATIVGAVGLATPLTDGSIETLNALGVNCLRARPGQEPIAWGARTMEASGSGSGGGADDWKYVNVRRLALYIEESISRGIRWAVFEPNTEPTWAKVRVDVGNFLHGLFLQGALQGDRPSKAFFVKCGPDTMSQGDVARGAMNVVVGFAPLRPAEFVMITLRQLAGRTCPP
jgi:phage tail sheath protein FI